MLRIIGHLSNIHSPSSFLNTSQISQHVVCRLVEGNWPGSCYSELVQEWECDVSGFNKRNPRNSFKVVEERNPLSLEI